jgi:Holliday junction DNA helicase RuvA
MIERLEGTVVTKGGDGVVLSVSGVGFLLDVSAMTLRDVPAAGEKGMLFTHLHVREESLQLFGFSSEEERELFRMFLGVSKIGPKLALAALSCRRAPDLKRALAAGDAALFASVPGIGKKTAERIILELREKMGDAGAIGGAASSSGGAPEDDTRLLARTALVELGYTLLEADKLLTNVDPDESLEQMIRQALGKRA